MTQTYSILLAEPNPMLREKLAGVLARDRRVWCVVQVEGRVGLERGATDLRPDFILADFSLLKDGAAVGALRRVAVRARLVALADNVHSAHLQTAGRLGLDGVVEKSRAAEWMQQAYEQGGRPPR